MPTAPNAGDTTKSPQRVRLSRLAPAVVLICLSLECSLRFLPPRFFTFRAWESMILFATASGPFVSNGFYHGTHTYGDLANVANLPRLRQYHEETFTTDAEGYRNRREPGKPFAGVLLVGDSFTVGSGVSDTETLSEQLSSMSGRPVYNGGKAPSLWELLRRLQMTRGLIVWEQLERTPLPSVDSPHPSPLRLMRTAIGEDRTEELVRMTKYASSLWSYSPLEIVFGRAVKALQDDAILPNPYRTGAVTAKLSSGREILFLPDEVKVYRLDRPSDPEFFVKLQMQLKEKGIGLLVLLVPDKYRVYHDLLLGAGDASESRPFFDLVQRRLIAANVPVVDLTPSFRAQAAVLLARDQYLYFLDDTHWNARGIREAAQAIIESTAFSQCSCR
jgi:hypothetical protein